MIAETYKRVKLFSPMVIVVALFFFSGWTTADELSALDRPAIQTALGANSFMLGAAKAGERIVSVGERGIILLSDDAGSSWRQADVPLSVTLTAIAFADKDNGYAIGHGGIVMATKDGGETWKTQLDGKKIAALILASAQKSGDEYAITSAKRMVADGPDKPLLDLLVYEKNRVMVVGAYGIALTTNDGGEHWNPILDQIENPSGFHIYTLRREGGRVLMAGEMGMVWLSLDDGKSFKLLRTPYEGSFFTGELFNKKSIVLAGLRGNIWRSDNNGIDWQKIESPVNASVTASLKDDRGKLVLVNQAGMIMSLKGRMVIPLTNKPFPPINNLIQKNNGKLLVVSARGLMPFDYGEIK